MEKKRFFIEIAYDGSAYHGWQIQPNAISVQEKLNHALYTLTRENIETIGAGRTDTGVHARQLYVHFDSANALLINSIEKFKHSLNALLPYDIAIKNIFEVSTDAHARFDATSRSYEYHIHIHKDPFLINRSWQVRELPDIEKMNEAAQQLLGTMDFSCFSKSNTQVHTNICTITEAKWRQFGEIAIFNITADRFLRNMVRAIVGTLMKIGSQDLPVSHVKDILSSKNRSRAGISVPAHGLYLTKVRYPYV
ncbi:tRNA pseudouridine(38-40) synthase TruA [Sphingobacterium faecale]|uniref:tRNA pseudouridine synthase A n=1 Tax=Sphingobacterium faecale TaxID=2803775 RepID=A0ABS1R542_9SPHI|nr:tRNA pseudouridine(38-40) synthase TruA [Sphingobacterium faecale]MBL1409620.1 tRNA pseudouridine(38-40) synthase TruA [Sphingobacterium faecale]